MNKNWLLFGVLFVVMLGMVSAVQLPVELGTSGNFVILAKSGVSTTGVTDITGDIGVSPISSTALTGFSQVLDSSSTFSTSSLVTGKLYASNYFSPTPSYLTTAVSDMETAYVDGAGRPTPDFTNLGSGDLSNMTLSAGLYKFTTGVLINTDLTLNGSSSDVWIFQIDGTLDLASATNITLIGGADASNVFWVVADTTTLGTTSHFEGNILDMTNVAINTGATINGRALAQTAVTLDAVTATLPAGYTPVVYVAPAGRGIGGGSNPIVVTQSVLPTTVTPTTVVPAGKTSFWSIYKNYIIGLLGIIAVILLLTAIFSHKKRR